MFDGCDGKSMLNVRGRYLYRGAHCSVRLSVQPYGFSITILTVNTNVSLQRIYMLDTPNLGLVIPFSVRERE